MRYLDRLDERWKMTEKMALEAGVTPVQLEAIKDLRDSEFGRGSSCRLRDMWHPYVDEHGDVVLMFEKLAVGSYEKIVSLSIDSHGIMTTRRHDTGEIELWDPELGGWEDAQGVKHRMWIIAEKFLEPLKIPSIVYRKPKKGEEYCDGAVAEIEETGKTMWPVFMIDQVERVWQTNYYDGPLAGFVRRDGQLLAYAVAYEDDVSMERIFTLRYVYGFEALKVHASRLSWWLEHRVNKSLLWKKTGWIKFPRFKLDFDQNTLYGYMSFRGSEHVTG